MSFFFNPKELTGNRNYKPRGFIGDPCKLCGLFKKCQNPKIIPFGKNGKRILLIGEAPGKTEDKEGRNFVGSSGKLLKGIFKDFDLSIDNDCSRTNVLQCFPNSEDFPIDKVEFCYERLEAQIKEYKPKLIMCFGQVAAARIIETKVVPGLTSKAYGTVVGDVFPIRKYGCWVSLNYHPSYYLRGRMEYIDLLSDTIERGLDYLDKPFPESFLESGINKELTKEGEIIDYLKLLEKSKKPVNIDFETNRLSPFKKDSKILAISISVDQREGVMIDLSIQGKAVWNAVSVFLRSSAAKVNQNTKFEEVWSRMVFKHGVNNWEWDTMLSAHLLDQRRNKKSLAFLAYTHSGEEYKDMIDVKHIESVSKPDLIKYACLDSRFPLAIRREHKKSIDENKMAYAMKFFMRGNKALADLEINGIKIDLKYYEKFKKEVEGKIVNIETDLLKSEVIIAFKEKYRRQININSNIDLNKLFFGIMDMKPLSYTAKGKPQVDQNFLNSAIDDEVYGSFFKQLLKYNQLNTLSNTFLGYMRHVENGYLHPTYNLWIARTFRSSCNNPNLQNIPKRDEYMAEIRKVFIPRHDFFIDADYKGAEVVVQAMLCSDKNLIKHIKEGYDIHKYWGARLHNVPFEKATKQHRYDGKNGLVFPLIYGASYKSIAKRFGLSERHVMKVENEFFDSKDGYADIKLWQKEKLQEYEDFGYVSTALGFRRTAPLEHTQIINTDVQATTFHCLLDGLERAGKQFKKYKLKSIPVLQVHDNILTDTVEKEAEDVIDILNECSCNKPEPEWGFTKGIPLSVEYSCGENWLDLESL